MKSASGKTMLVERSKLQKLMAMEPKVQKIPAGKEVEQMAGKKVKASKETNQSKYSLKPIENDSAVPEEIFLDDDDDDVDQRPTTVGSLKTKDSCTKSDNDSKSKVSSNNKTMTEDQSNDADEILLAGDEGEEVTIDDEVVVDGDAISEEVTIDDEVVVDGDATSEEVTIDDEVVVDSDAIKEQLKRKHDEDEVESKRMRKIIQG